MIAGSLADRDGRIQKGDRVLSINGRSTKGVSHREALSILKVGFTNDKGFVVILLKCDCSLFIIQCGIELVPGFKLLVK